MNEDVIIRPAAKSDLDAVGWFAAQLVRAHRGLDPERFVWLYDGEQRHSAFFASEVDDGGAILLVAARRDAVVGYVYGRLEAFESNDGPDSCGELIDVYVDEPERGRGVGTRLVEAFVSRLTDLGAPRIVLLSAVENVAAQRLFQRLGFRPTMIEMMRAVGPADRAGRKGFTSALPRK